MFNNYIYDKFMISKYLKLFSYELCFKVLRICVVYLIDFFENFRFGRDF